MTYSHRQNIVFDLLQHLRTRVRQNPCFYKFLNESLKINLQVLGKTSLVQLTLPQPKVESRNQRNTIDNILEVHFKNIINEKILFENSHGKINIFKKHTFNKYTFKKYSFESALSKDIRLGRNTL